MMRRWALVILFWNCMAFNMHASPIKDPNVSGQFYDADPRQLSARVQSYLKAAQPAALNGEVEIVISPHAGYMYSGAVAGHSFRAAGGRALTTVVILAPSHFFGFKGASVWPKGGFRTPLGVVDVDESFAQNLLASDPLFVHEPRAFEREHSLEVQIPFLQKTFSDFKIVPVILGQMSLEACQRFADKLNALIGQRQDVLVVVSSDMSHYHDGQKARRMDLGTLKTIEGLDADGLFRNCHLGTQEMCGFVPVTTALILAKMRGLKPQVLQYAHSGDVTGDHGRVVGYGAVAFYRPSAASSVASNADGLSTSSDTASSVASSADGPGSVPLNPAQKKQLLSIARQTIELYVKEKKKLAVAETDPRLSEKEGAFVTIHKRGALRGCIGHIVTDAPLYQTVRDMAIAAAAHDPRFSPVSPAELADIDVEVSVLSRPRAISDVVQIQMGVHGVIVGRGPHNRGVFLPQVATETGWSKEEFLSQLCSQKAGLKRDCWKDPATKLEIFSADVFSEKDIP